MQTRSMDQEAGKNGGWLWTECVLYQFVELEAGLDEGDSRIVSFKYCKSKK